MFFQSTPLINDIVTVDEHERTGRGSVTVLKDDVPIDGGIPYFLIVEHGGVGFVVELFAVGCSFAYLTEGCVGVFGVFLI